MKIWECSPSHQEMDSKIISDVSEPFNIRFFITPLQELMHVQLGKMRYTIKQQVYKRFSPLSFALLCPWALATNWSGKKKMTTFTFSIHAEFIPESLLPKAWVYQVSNLTKDFACVWNSDTGGPVQATDTIPALTIQIIFDGTIVQAIVKIPKSSLRIELCLASLIND